MTDYSVFDTAAFLDTFWAYKEQCGSSIIGNECLKFILKEHHTFWSIIQPSTHSPENGPTLLEFGGGPTIANLVSAAKTASRIIFAEYLESNRQAVSSWINDGQKAHDWSRFIRYVVKELEDDRRDEAGFFRTQEIKRKIECVIPCDMTKRPIVDVCEAFDVVATSFCVEDCCCSFSEYKTAIGELCKLVKPGGYLHMMGNIEETFYIVGQHTFSVLPLTKQMIEEAVKGAGMVLVNFATNEIQDNGGITDSKSCFSLVARKVK